MIQIGAVNYVAVVAAAIVSMILGMLWYGPLFGKKWMKLMGFSEKAMKSMNVMPQTSMVLGFVSMLMYAFVLAHFVSGLAFMGALTVGAVIWLGFNATVMAGSVLWEGKPAELYFLNALHQLVSVLAMSAVIALVG
jgi:hypothetical protein